jgi:hypothetical protein
MIPQVCFLKGKNLEFLSTNISGGGFTRLGENPQSINYRIFSEYWMNFVELHSQLHDLAKHTFEPCSTISASAKIPALNHTAGILL